MTDTDHQSAHPILYVLVVLVALNLAATAALIFSERPITVSESSTSTSLPAYLSDEEIAKLRDRVISLYNAHDSQAFYSEFDEAVRVQLTEDQFLENFEKLYEITGRIEEAAYIDYLKVTDQEGRGSYVLKFTVRVGDSEYSTGKMTITVYDRGDHYGLIGFLLSPLLIVGGQ
jgi:hypothetical protein